MDKKTLAKVNKVLGSDFRLVNKFSGGNANSNYLIENSSGEKLVARILMNHRPEDVPVEYRIQKHLTRKGVPTSVLIPLPNGELIIKAKKVCLTLVKFIESDKSAPDPVLIGEMIALYQKALEDFSTEDLRPNWMSEGYHNKLKFKKKDKATALLIQKRLHELYSLMSNQKLEKAVVHGDLNIGNMLRKDHRIIAVIDLESTEKNFRVLDIGMSIFQISPHYKFEYKRLRNEIVEGYAKITKLTRQEVDQIENATLYAAACSSLWNLSFEGGGEEFFKSYEVLQQKIEEGFK